MLQIEVPIRPELFDSKTQEFIPAPTQTLQLEHSLVSLSKWESKWCKPFLTKKEKTIEETIDYIRCMTLSRNIRPDIYEKLTLDNLNAINAYINSPMTATYISDYGPKKSNKEQVTSELIYYWMIALNIPFECQKWHINRLLMLIRVCEAKNAPKQKRSQAEIMAERKALNERRKRELNTRG